MESQLIDVADELERYAIELRRAYAPQPLGAYESLTLDAAAREIRRLRGVISASSWVAIGSPARPGRGFPGELAPCLVWAGGSDGRAFPATYSMDRGFVTYEGGFVTGVTHWMPIERPQVDQDRAIAAGRAMMDKLAASEPSENEPRTIVDVVRQTDEMRRLLGFDPPETNIASDLKGLADATRRRVDIPPSSDRPTVVTLCGSSRFREAYEAANRRETLAGRIVLSIGMFGHEEGLDMDGPVKQMLDDLHLRKIDLSSEILVLDPPCRVCPDCKTVWRDNPLRIQTYCSCGAEIGNIAPAPYVGESTRREIDYATAAGKRVRYLSSET